MDSVRSLSRRILGRMPSYRDAAKEGAPNWSRDIQLTENEVLLGVYENSPGSADQNVVVTSEGLIQMSGGRWEGMRYREIKSVTIPEDKYSASYLRVEMEDGRDLRVYVSGGAGRLRDIWEVLRFLDRVAEILRRPRRGESNPGEA